MSTLEEMPALQNQLLKASVALGCVEILEAIGSHIPLVEKVPGTLARYEFRPRAMMNCCLVSKFWRQVLMPILWRVHDTQLMKDVPKAVLTTYSHHARVLTLWNRTGTRPPIYTQLRHLTLGPGTSITDEGIQLINANTKLETLEMTDIRLFHSSSEDKCDSENDPIPLTNPLGHLQTSLQRLCVVETRFDDLELFYLLRDVAQGSLRTLELHHLDGCQDLQDLVFSSLTRLHIRLCGAMDDIYEIIGRSPRLEHLKIQGGFHYHPTQNFWHFKQLTHFLRGTEPEIDTLSGNENSSQLVPTIVTRWCRPQLSTLDLTGLYSYRVPITLRVINDEKYLELIRASSNIYNKHKLDGYLGSLRELHLTVWIVDDTVCEAIAVHSSSLETLRIQIRDGPRRLERITMQERELESHVLRKILNSCRRLKDMEYWDRNGNVDVSMVMDWIGGHSARKHASDNHNGGTPQQEIEEALNCPELETLTLKSYYEITEQKQMREARSRWLDGEGSGDDGGAGTWMMPSFKWDPTVQDGTAFLLGADQGSIGPSVDTAKDNDPEMEGEETIRRFLRYISPCRKLRKLRLAQVQLVKAKGNEMH
ncbi:hypothetical protein B0O80DRAFT_215333 [Mortierella sp. GBAus27b]|nr:hypothetical protein B0O80DRAFT_215333 [Mortierella sp. GBAus27b]